MEVGKLVDWYLTSLPVSQLRRTMRPHLQFLSRETIERIVADGYAENANEAVGVVRQLLEV